MEKWLLPSPRATKYSASDGAGVVAAASEAMPGSAIGVGGRPVRVYVLYGVSVSRSFLRRLPSNDSPTP
ncbi:hypothetical protein D3C87_2134180 [compost metagenome]